MGKQKRSENTYQKINTLYKRDINNVIMKGSEWASPEFAYLRNCPWEATEKIDGTNIRIEVTQTVTKYENEIPVEISWNVTYLGKTDLANIPKRLMEYLNSFVTEDKVFAGLGLKKFMNTFDWVERGWIISKDDPKPDYNKIPKKYTLYGEGYGVGIQKCGGSYLKNENSFIGFDVKVDDTYLLRENVEDIYAKAGIQTVPYHGLITIDEAIEKVQKGFISSISEDRKLIAEGLVLKSPLGLRNRRGERLIVKIKHCDYDKYRRQYGTDEIVEQTTNPKY